MQNFFDLADFSREQVIELLTLADRLQKKPEPQALAGPRHFTVIVFPLVSTAASPPRSHGSYTMLPCIAAWP